MKTRVAISEKAAAARDDAAPPYVLTLEGLRAPDNRGVVLQIYGELPGKETPVIGRASTMGSLGGPEVGEPRMLVIPLLPGASKYIQGKREVQFWIVCEKAHIEVSRASVDISR